MSSSSELESENWLDTTLSEAQPWISYCLSNHDCCRSTTPSIIPKRLVDVGPPDGSENPRLFVPSTTIFTPAECQGSWNPKSDTTFRYLCLSYCWGSGGNLTTTRDNLEARKTEILWDTIPQTIRDAILVTRKLCFRYLWVDALCILQGDNDDWATESSKMADIYTGAFLTISAALSPHVHYGLCQSAMNNSGKYELLEPEMNPLYQRGWALQERIISRRVLIFGVNGLFWECPGYPGFQGFSHDSIFPHIRSFDVARISGEGSAGQWRSVVWNYRNRSLTFQQDTLPALSGLAKVYHETTKYDYLAGLWRQSLLQDLLWYENLLDSLNNTKSVSSSSYIAPSWSWASFNKSIVFPLPDAEKYIVEVVDAQINLKDPVAPFGEVTGGSIVLHGPLFPTSAVDKSYFFVTMDNGMRLSNEQEDVEWMVFLEDTLKEYYGLLLESGKGVDGTFYKRVGFFKTHYLEDRGRVQVKVIISECTYRTVTII